MSNKFSKESSYPVMVQFASTFGVEHVGKSKAILAEGLNTVVPEDLIPENPVGFVLNQTLEIPSSKDVARYLNDKEQVMFKLLIDKINAEKAKELIPANV